MLQLEYQAALDALAVTPMSDDAYTTRWADVSKLSERLQQAQQLEAIHQKSHRHS